MKHLRIVHKNIKGIEINKIEKKFEKLFSLLSKMQDSLLVQIESDRCGKKWTGELDIMTQELS